MWYKGNAGVGKNGCGRWLGVSHRVGNRMSYWVLSTAERVVSRTTVQRINNNLEKGTDEVKQRMKEFDERIMELLKDQII